MNKAVTLALPSKGAIAEPTLNFLKDCGLRVDKPNQRQYTGSISILPDVTVLFQRATDVLYKVIEGNVHIGITGYDIVSENRHADVVIVHESLGYGHCSLVVAVPEFWADVNNMADILDVSLDFRERKQRNIRIATKYPFLVRQFLQQKGIHYFTLVKAEGAIEAAPSLGYADFIIDLTQTGTTLRENHLKTIPDGTILKSQACLIANKRILQTDAGLLGTVRSLLEYIDAAQHGRSYVQIAANVEGESPQDVARKVASNLITRGLQGPTVSPIFGLTGSNDNWFTVNIIIRSSDLLAAVEHLRVIGGTQTIVTPVKYIFMEQSESFDRLREIVLED